MDSTGRYFLGIDTGTNSSKGILLDSNLDVVCEYAVPHVMKNPEPQFYEHDAMEDWWGDFCRISRHLISTAGIDPRQIACVGHSALGADCLPVDRDVMPLRQAILYGIDARASEEISILQKLYEADEQHEIMMQFASSDIAPKIYWIRRHEPEVYEKTFKFLTCSSFIAARLTGEFVVDRYLGPGCFRPLYDEKTLKAVEGRYEQICRPDQLAQIREAADIAGYVTEKAAQETGLAPGTPVLTGTDDSGAEAISTGVVKPGRLMIQIGSSLYFILGTDRQIPETVLWSEEFIVPGLYTLSGGTNAAGSLTKWFRDEIFRDLKDQTPGVRDPYEAMMDGLQNIPPGSDGLITLPYFAGERVPVNDPDARGILFGLTLAHTREHLYKSALESAAYSIAQQIARMESHPEVSIDTICAVGGGTKNPIWLQIIADVTGKTIHVPAVTAGACYADALMAAMAVGHKDMSSYEDIADCIRYSKAYVPDPKRTAQYRQMQEIYNILYERTCAEAHRLGKIAADIRKTGW